MSLLHRAFDPYRVLNVQRSADAAVIRAAYRALAWRHHPDRGGAPDRMVAINQAWRVLSDPDRRAAFDADSFVNEQSPIRETENLDADSIIDFGRYAGWTVARLVDHDPEFLRWLARTPTGRRLSAEIDAALARRDAETASGAGASPRYGRRSTLRARTSATA
jgi:curved DNA-binding protein CbpA